MRHADESGLKESINAGKREHPRKGKVAMDAFRKAHSGSRKQKAPVETWRFSAALRRDADARQV